MTRLVTPSTTRPKLFDLLTSLSRVGDGGGTAAGCLHPRTTLSRTRTGDPTTVCPTRWCGEGSGQKTDRQKLLGIVMDGFLMGGLSIRPSSSIGLSLPGPHRVFVEGNFKFFSARDGVVKREITERCRRTSRLVHEVEVEVEMAF